LGRIVSRIGAKLPDTVVFERARKVSMSSQGLVHLSQFVSAAGRGLGSALRILLLLAMAAGLVSAEDKLSEAQRVEIIRAFLAESPFVHRALPRGKGGVHIAEDGKITPSEAELNQLIAQSGPAAKPGERVRISAVRFVHRGIIFDINGGPVKRKKWPDHINVGIGGIDPRASQPRQIDPNADLTYNGSLVFLALKEDVALLTADHIKDLLSTVLDFKATNVAEAYQKSLPPLVAAAVKNHHVLVGMDKEMVTCAMGRPPRRLRESQEGQDYEEWIYGAPPRDVEFIRFVDDKVVRIEDMKVSGEKLVRTQDEVGGLNGSLDASAQKQTRPDSAAASQEEERRSAPTLLRPGEASTNQGGGGRDPNPTPLPDSSSSGQPGGPR
jgi:sulfur carrier protein ThiS